MEQLRTIDRNEKADRLKRSVPLSGVIVGKGVHWLTAVTLRLVRGRGSCR